MGGYLERSHVSTISRKCLLFTMIAACSFSHHIAIIRLYSPSFSGERVRDNPKHLKKAIKQKAKKKAKSAAAWKTRVEKTKNESTSHG